MKKRVVRNQFEVPEIRSGAWEEPGLIRAQPESQTAVVVQPALSNLHTGSVIRMVIADDDTIFRGSLQALLQIRDQFDVIASCPDSGTTLPVVQNLKPDVLLLDYDLPHDASMDLLAQLRNAEACVQVVLLCQAITQKETVRALRNGARGILLRTETTDSLIECIQSVARGEYWLGKDGIRSLVQAICDSDGLKQVEKNRFGLTPREIEIIQAVLEGFSNPEIAANWSLSEQTVKHHLSHIFDKLGVYSRLELALFVVNHGIKFD